MSNLEGMILLGMRLVLVVLLYGFLVWAFATLWRDLKQQSQTLAKRRIPSIKLNFSNQDMPPQMRFNLPQFYLGRDPTCECMINNETVSSWHARLAYHHNQWWVEDLDSRNGTYLNERAVSQPTVLTNHDNLRCGEVEFSVELD